MNVAMVHLGDSVHPAHQGFADAIDADLVSCSNPDRSPHSVRSFLEELYNGSSIRAYDVIITEGARPLFAALASKLFHGTTVIYLCAEHRFYQIVENEVNVSTMYDRLKSVIGNYGFPLLQHGIGYRIDGVMAVSQMMADYMQEIVGKQTPIKVAHPFIQEDLYQRLGRNQYDPESKIVTTVAHPAHCKGIDILVDAWEKVNSRYPEAELQIAGSGHSAEYEQTPGVTLRGYVDDISEVYAQSGLYMHPSRVDAFPVAVLEALRGGVPTLVTENTGTKSVVKPISNNFVTTNDPDDIADTICWYIEQTSKDKREWSEMARSVGSRFDPNSQTAAFKSTFKSLLEEING